MLMRSEPFTEVNRLAQQLFGARQTGTWSRPTAMPADAYRNGDEFVIAFDLPGVDADAIDIDVERNVLTVRAERRPIDLGEQADGAAVRTAARGVLPAAVPRRRPGHRAHRRQRTTTACWCCGSRSRRRPSHARSPWPGRQPATDQKAINA